jgi:hypothetical protein
MIGEVAPGQLVAHVVRLVCTGRGTHPRLALATVARPRGVFDKPGPPRVLVWDERGSSCSEADQSGRDGPAHGPEEGDLEWPAAPQRIECRCLRCGRNRPMLTGEDSRLAMLFDALDAEPSDSPGSVLPFDTAGWSGPRGGTAGPRVLDVSRLG